MRPDSTDVPSARVEPPRSAGLVRSRLLTALDTVSKSRLGLVLGPAGCGKTTLLAQWAGTVDGTVVWYRADDSDRAPGRLLQRLGTALARAGNGGATPPAGRHRDRVDVSSMERVEQLALVLERKNSPTVLIVDNLQVLDQSVAVAELEHLLLLAPPHVRIVLGSRRAPAFNLARTELPDPIVLTADDLRFRAWEVERLFRTVYAAELHPDDAATLTRRTEGWAAALHLFRLSAVRCTPAERRTAIRCLSDRPRYAHAYLSQHVLAGLSPDLHRFLRRTCVFDVLDGERCDELLGGHDSYRTLLALEDRQALTVRNADGTFRYHEVLRGHLEMALYDELSDAGARAWYRRAADILASRGDVVEVLRARCRAADWDGVGRMLREEGSRLAQASRSDWLDLLPVGLTEGNPWISFAEARRQLADGQLTAAGRAAERAHAQFAWLPAGRTLATAVARSASTWLSQPTPPISRWDDVLRSATRRNPAAAADVAHTVDGGFARVAEGVALLLAGNYFRGSTVLRGCRDEPSTDPGPALTARLVLAAVATIAGDKSDVGNALDRVHLDAERLGLGWVARLARGIVTARGESPADLDAAHRVVAECEERDDVWGAALIQAAAVFARMRAGHADVVSLEKLIVRFRGLDAGVLEAWARAAHALAVAAEDLPEAALDARAAESFARSAGVPGALAVAYAALARCGPDQEGLVQLAESTAEVAGLGCQPWAWLNPPAAAASTGAGASGLTAIPVHRAARPIVDVTCFGRFRLAVSGTEADLTGVRPRARAALRLLALHAGRPVHRELLADSLWGLLDADAAMHNVQVAISSLRGLLEPGVPARATRLLVRDGESYLLALDEDSVSDLHCFDVALAAARKARIDGAEDAVAAALRRAIDLYVGDVLPEDGPAEWVTTIRETYRIRVAEAAATLAEVELRRGDPVAAVAAARRSVDIERWSDTPWRTLIRAHREAGDLAAAERSRRAYKAVLTGLGLPAEAPAPHSAATKKFQFS